MYEPGIIVRRPVEADLGRLAELVVRFYRFNEEFDPAWSVMDNAEERARDVAKRYIEGEGYTLVAAHDEELAGYIHAYIAEYPMLELSKQAVIQELYVKPQFRGRGIATTLLEHLISEASKDGVKVVTSMFPVANFVAEKFYKSRKFRPYISIYLREV